MPEVNKDTMILITISYQALQRAKEITNHNSKVDCTVVIVFAAFFIEAYANHIIVFLEKEQDVKKYLGKSYDDCGLNSKLIWFYHSFIDQNISKNDIYQKVEKVFPGIKEIIKFRNDVAHGIVDTSVANINAAENLQIQAKEIVNKLLEIVKLNIGRDLPRVTHYDDAIA